jgi:hypothetical protein
VFESARERQLQFPAIRDSFANQRKPNHSHTFCRSIREHACGNISNHNRCCSFRRGNENSNGYLNRQRGAGLRACGIKLSAYRCREYVRNIQWNTDGNQRLQQFS